MTPMRRKVKLSGKARLFVVSAPSGCGKGTILGEVFKDRDAYFSVSCTTRSPRTGETDGVNYHFISDEKFEEMIKNDEFLEYAGFVGNYYGTPAGPVKENLEKGRDVVLEIETQGAFQIKKKIPDAVLLFILPPSVAELKRRLNKRGTETPEVIEKRVARAKGEIEKSYQYDYVIMNDGLEDAVRDFLTVMDCAKNNGNGGECFRADNEETKKMIEEVLEL